MNYGSVGYNNQITPSYTQYIPQNTQYVGISPNYAPYNTNNYIGGGIIRGSIRNSQSGFQNTVQYVNSNATPLNMGRTSLTGSMRNSYVATNFTTPMVQQPVVAYGSPINNMVSPVNHMNGYYTNSQVNPIRNSFNKVVQQVPQQIQPIYPVYQVPQLRNGQAMNAQPMKQGPFQPKKGEAIINDLALYQAELKNVKDKIDTLYTKAIERSQKYFEDYEKTSKEKQAQNIDSSIEEMENSKVMDRIVSPKNNDNDGGVYQGEYLGEKKHGDGKMKYSNGLVYQGAWFNDQKHGFGVLSDSSGQQIYSGDWQNDVFNGKGFLTNLNATATPPNFDYKNMNEAWNHWISYEGEFVDGKMEGKGILNLSNGDTFNGKFQDGMVNGEGCFYRSTGEVILGVWNENLLVHHL